MKHMHLSEEFKEELNKLFSWRYEDISNLDHTILIILDYSPSNKDRPFSFAFSLRKESKCWISHDKMRQIGDNSPSYHPKYREFTYETRKFHPYSVRAEHISFGNIDELKKVCDALYAHIDQG